MACQGLSLSGGTLPPLAGNENDGGFAPTVSLQRRASREGNGEAVSRRGSGSGRAKQSRFRGVTFDKISQRWRAQVWMFNKVRQSALL